MEIKEVAEKFIDELHVDWFSGKQEAIDKLCNLLSLAEEDGYVLCFAKARTMIKDFLLKNKISQIPSYTETKAEQSEQPVHKSCDGCEHLKTLNCSQTMEANCRCMDGTRLYYKPEQGVSE